MKLGLVLLAVALLANAVLVFAVRSNVLDSAASRKALCLEARRANHSSRELWLRVIARTPHADADQVEAFERDLFRLFPPVKCDADGVAHVEGR